MAGICRDYKWTPDYVIHELPMSQAFALSSCSAWASGMKPSKGGYLDWQVDRAVAKIKREELTS